MKQFAIWAGLAVLAFVAYALNREVSQEEKGKIHFRDTIEQCWTEQKQKSLPPDQARFIAGACEKLERDFKEKYKVNP